MKKTTFTMVVLVVLIALLIGYIATDKMQQQYIVQMQSAFQAGYTQGIEYGVTSLFVQTNNCQPTIIRVENATRQVIDLACIQLVE